jgi:hypothetical protein
MKKIFTLFFTLSLLSTIPFVAYSMQKPQRFVLKKHLSTQMSSLQAEIRALENAIQELGDVDTPSINAERERLRELQVLAAQAQQDLKDPSLGTIIFWWRKIKRMERTCALKHYWTTRITEALIVTLLIYFVGYKLLFLKVAVPAWHWFHGNVPPTPDGAPSPSPSAKPGAGGASSPSAPSPSPSAKPGAGGASNPSAPSPSPSAKPGAGGSGATNTTQPGFLDSMRQGAADTLAFLNPWNWFGNHNATAGKQ